MQKLRMQNIKFIRCSKTIMEDEEIKAAIFKIVSERGIVKSQEELVSLLRESEINISPQNARLLAIDSKIKVRVITKRSNKEKPTNCPSCLRKLNGLYAINLLNEKTLVGLECKRCGYRGTLKSFSPFRYEFMIDRKIHNH